MHNFVKFSQVLGSAVEAQRVVIELASTALPKTCENFTKLCMNGSVVDASDRSAENWGYKGTNVHKIEKVR